MAISAIFAGIGPTLILPTIWTCGSITVLCISFKYGKSSKFSLLEKICLLISLSGIGIWLFNRFYNGISSSSSAKIALFSGFASVIIAGIPTTIKAWRLPWTDSWIAWTLQIVACYFSFLSVKIVMFDTVFVPIGAGIYQLITLIPIITYVIINKEALRQKITMSPQLS